MSDSQQELLAHLEDLRSDISDLRNRLAAVEDAVGIRRPCEDQPAVVHGDASLAVVPEAASIAPLFGWAFLGLSGAYVLRTLTESGTLPPLAGVMAGVAYSGWWLFLAAAKASANPMASIVYALTASLILAPLLWEAVVRFHVVSGAIASLLLVAFAIFGLTTAWRHNVTTIAFVATLTGLLTPLALFRETHDGQAWAVSVLVIAAAVEFSACRDHWLGLRWMAAAVADLNVLLLTMLVTARHVSPDHPTYATPSFVLLAQIALLCIYLASTADRTLIRRLPITGFEIGQAAAAFLVSVGGALRLAEVTTVGETAVGVFCLIAGASCYAISLAMLDRETQPSRNFYTYSTFGLLLAIAASRLLIGGEAVPTVWGLLAVCMMSAALVGRRKMLRFHAYVLLLLAVLGAGLPHWVSRALIYPPQVPDRITMGYIAVLVAAALIYAALISGARRRRVEFSFAEAFVPVAVGCWSLVGVLATFASPAVPGSTPLRTAVLTLLSLAAATVGVRAGRTELVWLAYTLAAVAGLKVLVEDFSSASSLGIVISLTLFGATLILLPRIVRAGRIHPAASERSMAKGAGA